jgi:electron transfer flavoprotein alpha subunit
VSSVLVLVEHDRGDAPETSYQALTFARLLAAKAGLGAEAVEAVTIGADADGLAATLGDHGACRVWQVHHNELSDYAPEAWADALTQVVATAAPTAVVACGTDRGHEVLAHVAAATDLPMATNVVDIAPGEGGDWALTRLRWGGSLLEDATLRAPLLLVTCAAHAFGSEPTPGPSPAVEVLTPTLDAAAAARTRVVDRVPVAAGATLATAAVVVSGGRGVGSPEGFGLLEELAELLGGAVGCSRVATNNGWRPHSDQVGQTGKRIAPELYIACGISGAIQHWVGMMAAKRILAVNVDAEAPMVTKADFAVIGDLHEVLKAVVSEIRERRS